MKLSKRFLLNRMLPVIVGASLGYAYYYFIGCNTGACPISSNPYISTLYGAFGGLIMAWPSKKRESIGGTDIK